MTMTTTPRRPRRRLDPAIVEAWELEQIADELAEIEREEARHAAQIPERAEPDPITPADGVEQP